MRHTKMAHALTSRPQLKMMYFIHTEEIDKYTMQIYTYLQTV